MRDRPEFYKSFTTTGKIAYDVFEFIFNLVLAILIMWYVVIPIIVFFDKMF